MSCLAMDMHVSPWTHLIICFTNKSSRTHISPARGVLYHRTSCSGRLRLSPSRCALSLPAKHAASK